MVSLPFVAADTRSWLGLGRPWWGVDGGMEPLRWNSFSFGGFCGAVVGLFLCHRCEEGCRLKVVMVGLMARMRRYGGGGDCWSWELDVGWVAHGGLICACRWRQRRLGLLKALWLQVEEVVALTTKSDRWSSMVDGLKVWIWGWYGSRVLMSCGMDRFLVNSDPRVGWVWAVGRRNWFCSSMVLKFVMAVLLAWCLVPGFPAVQNPMFGGYFGGLTEYVSVASRYGCRKSRLLFVVGLLHSVRKTDSSYEDKTWIILWFATLVALKEAVWSLSAVFQMDSVVISVGIIVGGLMLVFVHVYVVCCWFGLGLYRSQLLCNLRY